jgi:hypothetical protein
MGYRELHIQSEGVNVKKESKRSRPIISLDQPIHIDSYGVKYVELPLTWENLKTEQTVTVSTIYNIVSELYDFQMEINHDLVIPPGNYNAISLVDLLNTELKKAGNFTKSRGLSKKNLTVSGDSTPTWTEGFDDFAFEEILEQGGEFIIVDFTRIEGANDLENFYSGQFEYVYDENKIRYTRPDLTSASIHILFTPNWLVNQLVFNNVAGPTAGDAENILLEGYYGYYFGGEIGNDPNNREPSPVNTFVLKEQEMVLKTDELKRALNYRYSDFKSDIVFLKLQDGIGVTQEFGLTRTYQTSDIILYPLELVPKFVYLHSNIANREVVSAHTNDLYSDSRSKTILCKIPTATESQVWGNGVVFFENSSITSSSVFFFEGTKSQYSYLEFWFTDQYGEELYFREFPFSLTLSFFSSDVFG